jgi:SAM-dependent methyltransferase
VFAQTSIFYDAIYRARGKSYADEAAALAHLIRERFPDARTLLDVGCGTGAHLAAFEALGFVCRGMDADAKMVALARARCPEMEIDFADMVTFDLHARFDVVVALFGTTGYARIPARLTETIARLAAHLAPEGMLIVEPFRDRSTYMPGHVDAVFVDEPDLKIARMSLSKQMGAIAILDFNYLVATKTGVERYFERHELGLFDAALYREAFEAAGLSFASVDRAGMPFRRNLYLGRPASSAV